MLMEIKMTKGPKGNIQGRKVQEHHKKFQKVQGGHLRGIIFHT